MLKRALVTSVTRSVLLAISLVPLMTGQSIAQSPDSSSLVFQDWVLNCVSQKPAAAPAATPDKKPVEPAKETQTCEIVQSFRARTNNATVATLVVGKVGTPPERKFVAQVPIGVWLPDGISIEIDKKPPLAGQFLRCTPTVCIAQFDAKKDSIDSLKGGAEASLVFADSAGTKAKLSLSAKGFGDALAALEQRGQ